MPPRFQVLLMAQLTALAGRRLQHQVHAISQSNNRRQPRLAVTQWLPILQALFAFPALALQHDRAALLQHVPSTPAVLLFRLHFAAVATVSWQDKPQWFAPTRVVSGLR